MADRRVIVIGGGPGGYVAAIRAAQLGASVTLIEKSTLGGTCLNVGCIPTKVLLHAAELYTAMLREGPAIGILADNVRYDWARIMQRKNDVVKRLTTGVAGLLRSNGIQHVRGEARLVAPTVAEVDGWQPGSGRQPGSGQKLEADAIIIATGSSPAMPPVPGLDLEGVITSDGALSLTALPKRIAIVGGGVIGVEFASIFASFGASVTVLEMLPGILPGIDAEASAILRRSLEKKGVAFHTSARLNKVTRDSATASPALTLHVQMPEGPSRTGGPQPGSGPASLEADALLVATGRQPYTKDLGLQDLGVAMDKARIVTDERMATNIAGLYAVGDCTSKILLAHVASHEGMVAAENCMGHDARMDYKTVPSAIYTSPAVACVGLSEEDALKAGHSIRVGKFPLAANGKSMIAGDTSGMVKIIADTRHDEVLGVHIVGGPATDMIAEAALALRLEATLEEIVSTIHAHPTVSESVAEAALASWERAIHLPRPAKKAR